MAFTAEEVAYIRSQPLARIASVSEDGQPDVVPVGFEFDGVHFFVGGFDPANTRRHRNVGEGNTKIALVIDDLAATDPWSPRFLRLYGVAEVVERDGPMGLQPVLRVTPTISWSWNLSGGPLHDAAGTRRTVHEATPQP